MMSANRFERDRFALPMLVTLIVFFAAAALLPPVETHAHSLAVAAGFTNQLRPLVAILLIGGLVMGAFGLQRGAELPLRIGASTVPVRAWRWHLAAACLVCVLQVSLFQTWSQENSYFGARMALMDADKRPYEDFEFAYGYAVIYVPYGLHLLGFSIRHALVLTLDLTAVAGVLSIGIIVERWIANTCLRLALFWALILCSAFVQPGPSLNYNFGRYALPFALLILLTRHGPTLKAPALFVATAAANLLTYFMSAEMGLAFGAAGLAWVTAAYRALPATHVIAAIAAIVADLAGLVLFASSMFTTLLAFSQIQIILPVVPHPIMILTVACFLTVHAIVVPAAVMLWRGELDRANALTVAQACAGTALATALLPAVVGRSWPTMTIAYGFVSVIMAVGYFDAAGARRSALAVACVFIAFVAYCAQFVIRDDISRIAGAYSHDCTPADSAPCQNRRTDTSAASRSSALRRLATRFPNPYDPLGFVGYLAPHAVNFGYYPGIFQGNVITESGFARKREELQRAPYYLMPARDETDLFRARRARVLRNYARASLFPFSFHFDEHAPYLAADFIEMLFKQCRPLAEEGSIKICASLGGSSP